MATAPARWTHRRQGHTISLFRSRERTAVVFVTFFSKAVERGSGEAKVALPTGFYHPNEEEEFIIEGKEEEEAEKKEKRLQAEVVCWLCVASRLHRGRQLCRFVWTRPHCGADNNFPIIVVVVAVTQQHTSSESSVGRHSEKKRN